MPNVTEAFVKNSKDLAEGVVALQTKLASAEKKVTELEAAVSEKSAAVVDTKGLTALAEVAADTLVSQGLVPANEKAAAIATMMNHAEVIQALNKTAQMVRYESMGTPETEKVASASGMAESDRRMLEKLGFNV